MYRRRALLYILAGTAVLLMAATYAALPSMGAAPGGSRSNQAGIAGGALAAPLPQETKTPNQAPVENLSIGNDTCLQCHNNPNLTMKLGDGELLGLYIPAEVYNISIHGQQGYACVQCHTTVGNYPHPPFSASDARDVTLQLNQVCQRCHASKSELTQDSVHAAAMAGGNRNAAVCTDCHTAHAVRKLTDPQTHKVLPDARTWIPQTCAKCHYAIYQKYSTSVHGSALLGEGNPDVPTCIDCHGVHNIENPTTAAFRLKSPEICAKCHTDASIMDKYGISTQVLNTYVADFHGTTVAIFEKQHPDQQTNKPVCFDCHGVHDIKRVDDPVEGLRIKENLLARCQVCHPGASTNFPSAWLSHYIPSTQRNPLVFTVNTFYKFFIPGVLGGMAILVLLDLSSVARKRVRKPGRWAGKVGVFPAPATDPELQPQDQRAGQDSGAQNGVTTATPESPIAGEPATPVSDSQADVIKPQEPASQPEEKAHPEPEQEAPKSDIETTGGEEAASEAQESTEDPGPPQPGQDSAQESANGKNIYN